jgi:hypothetical protein
VILPERVGAANFRFNGMVELAADHWSGGWGLVWSFPWPPGRNAAARVVEWLFWAGRVVESGFSRDEWSSDKCLGGDCDGGMGDLAKRSSVPVGQILLEARTVCGRRG